ncbi:YkvA family protein [Arthrobacter ruber]|uniref:YkvA family protein n=1 Tax=Arthrobacter ruber TaxID=1258893 RepID=UPI000CF43CE2|nr:YkvA family protein [Arthrobacter ruber]
MDPGLLLRSALALLGAYALFLLALAVYARRHPEVLSLTDVLRLGPDVLRLLRRLAADRAVPWWVRLLLWGLVVYLILPLDLVPDFLPVIGYADDVVLVAAVLRTVVRSTGAGVLERHWPGTDGGLRLLRRLAGVGPPGTGGSSRNTA